MKPQIIQQAYDKGWNDCLKWIIEDLKNRNSNNIKIMRLIGIKRLHPNLKNRNSNNFKKRKIIGIVDNLNNKRVAELYGTSKENQNDI